MDFISLVKNEAKERKGKIIVYPEGEEKRIIQAANIVKKEGIAEVVLLGDEKVIREKGLDVSITVYNPQSCEFKEEMAELLYDLRKEKGMTKEGAQELVKNPLYLGVLMVKKGLCHGEVAGSINTTGDVLRPAFQIVGTNPGISVVSGLFIMIVNKQFGHDGIIGMADCAVNITLDSKQLAEVAIASGETYKKLTGVDPIVAMLSFSTKGSAKHGKVDMVTKALELVKEKQPNLIIDGELQADAALIPEIGNKKAPGSKVAGHANVLVFPDLASGNIGYKLVQRLAGAQAIGPVLQGMTAPINDLSRGCSVDDIVNLTAITVLQGD